MNPSQQEASMKFTLILIVGTSFGTVLGVGFFKLISEGSLVHGGGVMTFLAVVGAAWYLLINNRERSKIKSNMIRVASVTPSRTNKKQPTPSGLHLLESKYSEDSTISDPYSRAVEERCKVLGIDFRINREGDSLEEFYKQVYGKCCESVIGALWIPIGVVGPIPLVGGGICRSVLVPMATVEGALIASVNRGCKVLRLVEEESHPKGGGLSCVVSRRRKGITRGPCFRAASIECAAEFLEAMESCERFSEWKKVFDSSSPGGHVRLCEIRGRQIGHYVYLRVRSDTSEAMGMNMISRGCQVLFEHVLNMRDFSEIAMESLSGNFCTDKKPSALNWIEGRGREVISSVRIPRSILARVLGIDDPESLVKLNLSKNLIGSAAAGSTGGFNAHVANVVAAVYMATGQDVAQVVDASQAMTLLEFDSQRDELVATLTMPCVEVGIRGGGTGLLHQKRCLDMILGEGNADNNVDELARCIGLVSLAGELSLLASLQTGTLVSAHFSLNHK